MNRTPEERRGGEERRRGEEERRGGEEERRGGEEERKRGDWSQCLLRRLSSKGLKTEQKSSRNMTLNLSLFTTASLLTFKVLPESFKLWLLKLAC